MTAQPKKFSGSQVSKVRIRVQAPRKGARMPAYHPTQQEISSRELTSIPWSLYCFILGWVLGDSYITWGKKASSPSGGLCCLSFVHSIKQIEYLKFKWRLMGPYTRMFISKIRMQNLWGKTYCSHSFRTLGFQMFGKLESEWYFYWTNPNTLVTYRLKRVPLFIYNIMGVETISGWFQDDGSRGSTTGYMFYVGELSLFDVALLRGVLEQKFSLHTTCGLTKKTKSLKGRWVYWIRVSASSKGTFQELLEPLQHKSMLYKFIQPLGGPYKNWVKAPLPSYFTIIILWLKDGSKVNNNLFVDIQLEAWENMPNIPNKESYDNRRGKLHWRSIAVSIHGQEYATMGAAKKGQRCTAPTIRKKIQNLADCFYL
jgi:hypothetical protein